MPGRRADRRAPAEPESFTDAEFGEDVLELVQRAVAEIV